MRLTERTKYFNMDSFSQIEEKIAIWKKQQQLQQQEQEAPEVEKTAVQAEQTKYIEFVCVVGFHHSVGSQVEFVYPPLQEDVDEKLSGEFIRLIP